MSILRKSIAFVNTLKTINPSQLDNWRPVIKIRPNVDRFVLGLLDNPISLRHFTTNPQDSMWDVYKFISLQGFEIVKPFKERWQIFR
jgi:hypothetical protein